MVKVTKLLSANDTGETGGHQAGICVPKRQEILSFFPTLDSRTKNPRMTIVFHCMNSGEKWTFNYIYYNNKFFGGTRNEYRLTGMTKSMCPLFRSDHIFGADDGVEFFFRDKAELHRFFAQCGSVLMRRLGDFGSIVIADLGR